MNENVIVAVFPSHKRLMRALDHLMEQSVIEIERAAVVTREANGETLFVGDDLSADEGGIVGSLLGAALALFSVVQLGALALPTISAVLAVITSLLLGGWLGRWVGRMAAALFDFSIYDDVVDTFTQQLQIGKSALLLQLCSSDANKNLQSLRDALKPFEVELIEPIQNASMPAISPQGR